MNGLGVVGFAAIVVVGLSACSPHRSHEPSAKSTHVAAPSDIAVERVSASVSRDGAATYLKRVNDEDNDWQAFLAKSAAGDAKALALAARLRPAADAGNAEAIDTATAQALPKAPLAVLKLTDVGARVDTLCTSPFIESEPGVEERYNKAAIHALDDLPVPQRSASIVQACRLALERVAKRLSEQQR